MRETAAAAPSRFKAMWRLLTGRETGMTPVIPTETASSNAGQTVGPNNALELAAVWSCVRLLSETGATLPLMLYETAPSGDRRVARENSLFTLLHDAPHYDFTAVEFWEGVMMSLVLWGNAYALKDRMGKRLVSLTPLRCDQMAVKRNRDGSRRYEYSAPTGLRVYTEDEIFHVRGFGGAGDVGLSTLSFARHSMGSAMAADGFASAMFANGVRPSGVLMVDKVLTPEQREQLQKNIVAPFVGSDKAGGVMVFEAGMKFQPVTMTPEDAQFLQTRSFQVEEICRWFRVPPFMIGHTEKTTSWGTGLEQQLIGFLTFALRPYLVRIAQAISRSLIEPGQRAGLKAEFVVEGLLRADSQSRANFYEIMVRNGLMTRNEVRRIENMPAMPGGDTLTVQAQNVSLDGRQQGGAE